MKRFFLSVLSIVSTLAIAQSPARDGWAIRYNQLYTGPGGATGITNSIQFQNKLFLYGDTTNSFFTGSRSYIGIYDAPTNAVSQLSFTPENGEVGLTCATAAGSSYLFFGGATDQESMFFFPALYKYDGSTGTVSSELLSYRDNTKHKGIFNLYAFGAANQDTLRVFAQYDDTIRVFKKHYAQTGFDTSVVVTLPMNFVSKSLVFQNELYIGGDSANHAVFMKSADGIHFSHVTGFSPSAHPDANVCDIDTLNGELYISEVTNSDGTFYIKKFDGSTYTTIVSPLIGRGFNGFKNFKKRLWYAASESDLNSNYRPSIFYIHNGTSTLSVDTLAPDKVVGYTYKLNVLNDSLYLCGDYTEYGPPYIYGTHIYKLNPPQANFTYNNNQLCLNGSETFTSTSLNTDSLRWIYDNNYYYAASTGSTAWMNYSFNSTGSHTVGLIAFGGTLTDTMFLSVNVYSVSASIAATRTLVCYNSNVSGSSEFTQTTSGTMGTISYQWQRNFPVTTVGTGNSYTYTPSSFGTTYAFWLIATDQHGCSAYSNTLTVATNPLYDIDGNLYTGSSPTITSTPGDVILYKYQPSLGMFDSLTYLTTTSWGYFDFPQVDDGDYILKAVPAASSLQISYYGNNAAMWKDAIPFTHTCANPSTINIDVMPMASIGPGMGYLSGTIREGNAFGQKSGPGNTNSPQAPGNPIGGIIVKGGKNPGGTMFIQTTTNAAGQYTLSNIPDNQPGEYYFIMVDIPGLDTSSTYHMHLIVGNNQHSGLDFMVDSVKIYPMGVPTGIATEKNLADNTILVYPNPAKDQVYINYTLSAPASIAIEMYDVLGKLVKTIQPSDSMAGGKHVHMVPTSDLGNGIYFIKTTINSHIQNTRIIITH